MLRKRLVLPSVLWLTCFVILWGAAAPDELLEITGRITNLDGERVTIQNDQVTLTLTVTNQTVRNRETLSVGDGLTAFYYEADILVAKEIRVQ